MHVCGVCMYVCVCVCVCVCVSFSVCKASMIWIIGEYAERIKDATELLEIFVQTFQDESVVVRFCLISFLQSHEHAFTHTHTHTQAYIITSITHHT